MPKMKSDDVTVRYINRNLCEQHIPLWICNRQEPEERRIAETQNYFSHQ